ncbi:T9SS type A sorting domain-containing protein [Myroides sp. JBRI-B21084]|uniref:T9SS type A sorting domain-containing protein n=1 Tax=Myroides sp. JBRI-B21084 TaxID=3119977 RepID=UPI0026E1D46F|nr:T9SS type A sorting domain-containing protein [Paenimyroides cloacae]WKW45861.1 T9SS type A sorting domain-containing protein [Paenimyroides cloacae]
MKKVITHTIPLFLLLITPLTNAQVLYSENFNNLSPGIVGTDYTGTTPGQGGWYLETKTYSTLGSSYVGLNDFKIVTEPGRGNVLEITSPFIQDTSFKQNVASKKGIEALWNNRTVGNNVLKIEFDLFTGNNTITATSIPRCSITLDGVVNPQLIRFLYYDRNDFVQTNCGVCFPQTIGNIFTSNPTVPRNTWLKIVFYFDYTNKKMYLIIPTVGAGAVGDFLTTESISKIHLQIASYHSDTAVHRFDNFEVTALNAVPPSVILNTNKQLATKFNLYPNPATNMVNITNEENMQVNQITVYNLAGKQVSTQAYNNPAEIQLNVEHLASGTYLLYLQTAQGTAVKQLIKK